MLAKIKTGRDVRAYEDTNRGYQHEGEKRFSTDQEERVAHRSPTTDAAKRDISRITQIGDPRDSTMSNQEAIQPHELPHCRNGRSVRQSTLGRALFQATDTVAYLTVAPIGVSAPVVRGYEPASNRECDIQIYERQAGFMRNLSIRPEHPARVKRSLSQ